MLALRLNRGSVAVAGASRVLVARQAIRAFASAPSSGSAAGGSSSSAAAASSSSSDDKPTNARHDQKHFAFSAYDHPLGQLSDLQRPASKAHLLTAPAYTEEETKRVTVTHVDTSTFSKKIAHKAVAILRGLYDKATGYDEHNMTEEKWVHRFIFLESIAGVPGMVGGMIRHLHSLRLMRRDHGWIHTLIEEAENERMHLLTFLELRKPGPIFRLCVLVGQGVFFNAFFATYLFAPRVCHRFVGYLEEEAVRTYTHAIKDLDSGKLTNWTNMPAPKIAVDYWQLKRTRERSASVCC